MTTQNLTVDEGFQQAVAHHQAGRLAEAERLYRAVLDLNPNIPGAHYNLALIGLTMNNPDGALPFLRAAAALKPSEPEYSFTLCRVLRDLGHFDEARDHARKAAAIMPNDPQIARVVEALEEFWFPCLQGSHAPARQIYMSALVDQMKDGAGPLAILEVGSFMGASLCTWATAVDRLTTRRAEITCIDPWEAAEMDQYVDHFSHFLKTGAAYQVFRHTVRLMPERVSVTELRGFSSDILPKLAGRKFDIIYIDGCHLHPEVHQDLIACAPLLAEGGVICGDDLELQLHQVDVEAAQANARVDYVRDPRTGGGFHPGVTLGVGIAFGPVSAYQGFWAMRRRANAFEPVAMAGARGVAPYHWPSDLMEQAVKTVQEDGLIAEII